MTPATEHSPAQIEDKVIQLHRDMVEIVQDELGLNEKFANPLAAALVNGLRKRYGGNTVGRRGGIYIPAPGKEERNAAIRARFDGTTASRDALCKEFDISRSHFYTITGRRLG